MKMNGGYPIYGNNVGILMLELGSPLLPGNVGNAKSYNFPVRHKVMKGMPADWWCDEQGPDEERCKLFIKYAKELEAEGVKAITTGCGYFAVYQEAAAKELSIPLFASPLLMAPMVSRMLPKEKSRIGILCSGQTHLSEGDFLERVGVDRNVIPVAIDGMEIAPEFHALYVTEEKTVADYDLIEAEVLEVASRMVEKYPDIGAFIFECSDLPPFSHAVARATGRPVFDFIRMIELVNSAIAPRKFED
ncbi:MAG: aspartate/glutamate racemase family protein [Clostridiales bacterium]|nr:aspartate/glutamate racemase family protein [Clostridiales bacterium]